MEENKKDEIAVDENLSSADKEFVKKRKRNMLIKEVFEWTLCIVIALVIAFLLKFYIGTFTTVQQISMKPTLQENQKLWLNRTIRTFNGDYKRGDIATFKAPRLESVYISNESPKAVYEESTDLQKNFVTNFLEIGKISLIKRVIGVPGDKIKIEDGKVYVNGKLQDEEYVHDQETESKNLTDFTVPEGYYFMVGDNRAHSSDSRAFGCIPEDMMEGRVVFSVWPLNRLGDVD